MLINYKVGDHRSLTGAGTIMLQNGHFVNVMTNRFGKLKGRHILIIENSIKTGSNEHLTRLVFSGEKNKKTN